MSHPTSDVPAACGSRTTGIARIRGNAPRMAATDGGQKQQTTECGPTTQIHLEGILSRCIDKNGTREARQPRSSNIGRSQCQTLWILPVFLRGLSFTARIPDFSRTSSASIAGRGRAARDRPLRVRPATRAQNKMCLSGECVLRTCFISPEGGRS